MYDTPKKRFLSSPKSKVHMKLVRPKKKALVVLLLNRTVVFLFLMNLLAVYLYAVGTAQGFMDATQCMLLRLISLLGMILGISALYAFLLEIVLLIRVRSPWYLAGAGVYFLLGSLGAGLSLLSSFVLAATAGS